MNILQIGTYDVQGGAARAAYRLHLGLQQIGQSSRLLVRQKVSDDPTVVTIAEQPAADRIDLAQKLTLTAVQAHCINHNRSAVSNTPFTLPYPGFDLTQCPEVAAADIINLHWIAYFLSPITLSRLAAQKPIVWTLHDMWAFTGGCHYSAGCENYQQTCQACPQLETDPYDLAAAILHDRITEPANLTIVCPSQWLAQCARQSQRFCDHRVEVIPYGIETDVFVPHSKPEIKQRLGIPPDSIGLLIGASNGNERRKGFEELLEILQIGLTDAAFQKLVTDRQLTLMCFGVAHEGLEALKIPLRSFGEITSDAELSEIYAAADLFLLPSLEDNFPNTMLEAASCGTPTVAFATGGMKDFVPAIGQTVPPGDVQQFASAIVELVQDADRRRRLSETCRQTMTEHYTLEVQANRYLSLYEELAVPSTPAAKFADSHTAPVNAAIGKGLQTIFPQLTLEALTTELQQTQLQARRSQARLQHLRSKLQQTEQQLQQVETELATFQQSKFWQLRSRWLKLKQKIGFSD